MSGVVVQNWRDHAIEVQANQEKLQQSEPISATERVMERRRCDTQQQGGGERIERTTSSVTYKCNP